MEFGKQIRTETIQSDLPQLHLNSKKKLRESCDNCAVSKVRCSKSRPTCNRCEDRGICCLFSPSRRSGKRRRVSVISSAATVETNTTSSGSNSPHALGNLYKSDSHPPFHSPLILPLNDHGISEDGNMSWVYPLGFGLESCQLENPIDHHPIAEDTTAHSCQLRMVTSDAERAVMQVPNSHCEYMSTTFENPQVLPETYFQVRESSKSSTIEELPKTCSQGCMTIALNISTALHITSQTCTWTSRVPPSWEFNLSVFSDPDQIMATNKEAIDTTADILLCSCSLDRHLWLSLTLVCSKIISRYSVVVWGHSEKDSMQARHLQGMMTRECQGSQRATMQLILTELYRLSEVIGKLTGRFLDSRQREFTKDVNRKSLAEKNRETSLAIGLEGLLRAELQSMTDEVIEVLRSK